MKQQLRKILRRAKWTLLGVGIFCALVVLFVEVAVNLWGYPQWVRRKAENALLSPGQGICIIGWLKGGPFTGFEAEDVIVDVHTPVGIVHVEVPSLELQLSIPSLFALEIKPTRLVVRDAKASLQLNRDDALSLHSLTGQLRINTHDTLQATLSTQAAGINLGINATLYNGAMLPELLQEPSETSPAELKEKLALIRSQLTDFHHTLSCLSFGINDTFVQANVRTDVLDWEKTTVEGEYGMNDAVFNEIVIPKQRGRFQYRNHAIRLDDFQILLSSNEVIKGSMEYLIRSEKLSAQIFGRVFPNTIARLAAPSSDPIPDWLHFLAPIEFDATLNHIGHDWQTLQPTIHFTCGEIVAAGLSIHKCSGRIDFSDQLLHLQDATVELDYRQRETIHGGANWNFKTSELDAHLKGTVFLPHIIQGLGYNLPGQASLEINSGTSFELTLNPSQLDWTKWQLQGTIRQPRWRLAELELLNSEAQFSLHHGELEVSKLATQPLVGKETRLCATLHCRRLADLFSRRRSAAADFHAWLNTKPEGQRQPEAVFEAVGTIETDFRQNTIALYNGHCGVFPKAICDLLEPILHITPDYQLDWLHCPAPGSIDFTIPAFPLDNWERFRMAGTVHFDQCELQQIPLKEINADFSLDGQHFRMDDLALEGKDGNPRVRGKMAIEFSPFAITFTDLSYSGDPLLVTPLLVDPSAKEIFREIWEPFAWAEDASLLQLNLGLVEFRNLPAQRSWLLNIQGFADAANFRYRQVTIPKAHCRLDLALPNGGLHVLDVVLDSQNPDDPTRLTGEAHFDFANNISGHFDLHFHEGELDTLNLLRNVAESLVPVLEPLELSRQTYFDAHGNFVLGANPFLRLSGSVESPYAKFRALELHNIKGQWLATPQFIHWDCNHAEFFGGRLSATGEYNHANGTGQCLANVKDLPLQELIRVTSSIFHEHEEPTSSKKKKNAKDTSEDTPEFQPGLLDLETKLAFYLNWANRPLYVEGNGRVSIHDADLWHAPLLTSLAKIISVGTFNIFSRKKNARLGTISRLKAAVEFQGKRIYIPEIKTNGTVVALSGSGEYDLEEKQMDFLVSGHFLQNLSVINWLLRPLSWAFKAELLGKPSDYTWHLRSGWHKLKDKDDDNE